MLLEYKLPAALNALWQTAVLKLMDECGKGATPLDALKLGLSGRRLPMILQTEAAECGLAS